MAHSPDTTTSPTTPGTVGQGNGSEGPSLQALLAERDRLFRELQEARDEVMRLRCRTELLREEWFIAKVQEEEYRKYIRKLTGTDPYIALRDVVEAEKNGLTMAQMLAEMETVARANSSGG
jgi:hypothetical protein